MLTLLTAASVGVDRHFTREIEEVGPRVVWLFPGTIVKERVGERGARDVELEIEDVARIDALAERRARGAERARVVGDRARAAAAPSSSDSTASSPRRSEIRNFAVARGRLVSTQDVRDDARVAFLGARRGAAPVRRARPGRRDAARRVARVPRDRRRAGQGRPARQHGRPGRQGGLHPRDRRCGAGSPTTRR